MRNEKVIVIDYAMTLLLGPNAAVFPPELFAMEVKVQLNRLK